MIIEILEHWLRKWVRARWPEYEFELTQCKRGKYGLVFVFETKEEHVFPQKFCVKTLNPEKLKPGGRDVKPLFEREMRLWLNMPPHWLVLPALGLEFAPAPEELKGELDVLPLVRMPFCDASLSECIRGEIEMPLVDRLIILAQICCGLRWLYEHGLQGHGDLKPDNILLRDLRADFDLPDGEDCFPSKRHYWIARITDLGWANIWIEGGGTYHAWRPYLAPERFQNVIVPEASDIFAIGVIACELLSGKHPAGEVTEVLAKKWDARKWEKWATSGRRCLDFEPTRLRDVIDQALSPDPSARPSAYDLQSVFCKFLQQEYGLNIASWLDAVDKEARKWDTESHRTWAALEMAQVSETQRDKSISELEERLTELDRLKDDRSTAKWLVVAKVLKQLLRRRGHPFDVPRIAALAMGMLDRLLSLDDRGKAVLVEELYGADSETLGITDEVFFMFVREGLANLREAIEELEKLYEKYRKEIGE